jgi:hypothetical protein
LKDKKMLKHVEFIIYCIEEYRNANKLTGRQVINIFEKNNIYEFIENSYDALHTYGGDNIVWNIQDYIEHR